MSRGVHFTDAQRKVLRQVMLDAWGRKKGRTVPARRMRFNPRGSSWAYMKSETYIRNIRNQLKKEYAKEYLHYLAAQGPMPYQPKRLSYMAAQGVRNTLDEIWREA